jgi:hypothetical protein
VGHGQSAASVGLTLYGRHRPADGHVVDTARSYGIKASDREERGVCDVMTVRIRLVYVQYAKVEKDSVENVREWTSKIAEVLPLSVRD